MELHTRRSSYLTMIALIYSMISNIFEPSRQQKFANFNKGSVFVKTTCCRIKVALCSVHKIFNGREQHMRDYRGNSIMEGYYTRTMGGLEWQVRNRITSIQQLGQIIRIDTPRRKPESMNA